MVNPSSFPDFDDLIVLLFITIDWLYYYLESWIKTFLDYSSFDYP